MVCLFIEQCEEGVINKSQISSAVPPIKQIRTSIDEKIRRTVTFNFGASQGSYRINSAVEIRPSKSLGAADSSSIRRVDIVKRSAQKAITYASRRRKDSTVAAKGLIRSLLKKASPFRFKRAATGRRIVRHRNFQKRSGRKSFQSVRRHQSAPKPQQNTVPINAKATDSDSQSSFYLSEVSSQINLANHCQIASSESEESANDTTEITENSTDSTATGGSWGYRRKKVSKIPTFIQRQEAWQRRTDRILRKPLDPAQVSDSQQYSSDSSDSTAEPLIGGNKKEINHDNHNSSECSRDSKGLSILSQTTGISSIPPPDGCGQHPTRPHEGSMLSPSVIHSTNLEV